MSRSVECVITGCALIRGRSWAACDVYKAGSFFIAVANCDAEKGVVWNEGEPFYKRQLEPTDWWERRGVFVMHESEAGLNQAARDYLIDGSDASTTC